MKLRGLKNYDDILLLLKISHYFIRKFGRVIESMDSSSFIGFTLGFTINFFCELETVNLVGISLSISFKSLK